jgi:toxin ParE1/3/4
VIYFFHDAARVEHLEHVAYYESCQIGLGARYLSAFDVAMRSVCEAPDRYRVEFPPAIRKYRVPGFPYNILYRIVCSDIEVLVVAPHRRRPGYWAGRL